ncbi:MAG TPA: peptide ABC transporter substrate-binding protein [Pseudoneobacillus sp.]|nr:peptide ABC transporter substrate-binding protein [Pseudoneobacillus sp.]
MRKKRYSFFALLLVAIMLLVSGCSSFDKEASTNSSQADHKSGEKKILRTNNSEEPGSLHPGLAEGTHDSWVLNHVFEGLTVKSPKGEILPGMAKSWESSEDGLTWTFHLKEGMKWSNGDPLTAKDFEYAWKYVLNPETGSVYSYQLYYLKGAEDYNAGKAGEEAVGVKALDSQTLEVTLSQPTPYFIDLTSFYTYYPINKKVQEENPDWYKNGDTYVSNGPFKLTEWKHKEKIVLEKNDLYYDKDKINLDGVELSIIVDGNTAWQMYKSGDFDLLTEKSLPPDVTGKLIADKDPEMHNGPDLATYYLSINTKVKPFNNPKIRKALSMTINRQEIVEHVAQGGQKPAFSLVPPGILDVNGDFQENAGELIQEDVKAAKALFEEGLKEEGLKKLPPFVYLYNTDEKHKAIGETIQESWRKNLGIEMTLENVEQQVKLDRQKTGDYVVSRSGWIGDYVDPMTFLDLFLSDASYNDPKWGNKEYDELIQLAKTSDDTAIRMDAMHKAEEILMDESPIIPIFFYTKPHVYKPNVTGIYTLINDYPSFKYADIE